MVLQYSWVLELGQLSRSSVTAGGWLFWVRSSNVVKTKLVELVNFGNCSRQRKAKAIVLVALRRF